MKHFIFLTLIVFLGLNTVQAQDARGVIKSTTAAISNAKTLEYIMIQEERINGSIYKNTIYTKVNVSPVKVYIDNLEGDNEGKELIYVTGERNNKVYINVLFGIALSPFNGKVRKNQHHVIIDSGFGILKKALNEAVKRADAEGRFDEIFTYNGSVTYDGKSCHKVTVTDPTFSYVDYTIKNGESLYSIAINKNVSEQLIIEKNSSLSSFYSAEDGMVIKIPTSYSKKTILYIDKENNLPIYQEMHDEKGMFEKYEFTDLKVNPSFTDMDFSEDNENYNF